MANMARVSVLLLLLLLGLSATIVRSDEEPKVEDEEGFDDIFAEQESQDFKDVDFSSFDPEEGDQVKEGDDDSMKFMSHGVAEDELASDVKDMSASNVNDMSASDVKEVPASNVNNVEEDFKAKSKDATVTDAKDEVSSDTNDAAFNVDGDAGGKDGDDDNAVTEEEDVKVLTSANFDDVIESEEIILVEFYAPWCGHCKHLAPIYAKAAKTLKENDPPVPLAKVDATEHADLATRFEVSGYPTLKFFKNGQAFDYDGGRDEFSIVEFMKERADPLWKPPPDAVITLTKDNFTEVVNKEKLMLVEFYAPWCGHCKKLAPGYEKAAKELMKRDPPIKLAKVDATVETELASQYEVTGYPTLKMFREGRASEYKGPREERGIIGHMIQQEGEAAKQLDNEKSLQDYMKNDDVTIIGFFDKMEDPRLRVYMDAANDLREDHKFAFTLSKDARNRYKVNPGSIVVFNAERYYTKYEPKWHILNKEEITAEEVKTFIEEHQVPLVGTYETGTEKRYNNLKPLCLVFYTVDWSFDHRDATQLWRRKIADIAKDYKGKIYFAIVNEENYEYLIKDFGLDDSGEEMNIGILAAGKKKYTMEPMEEFDADDIREFLDKFSKGKLEAIVKSQPIPKKQGLVTTVVGKTFDKIIRDEKRDRLIEFYAPWCGHCKNLEPKYKELARNYKHVKNLVIAKMDATENDVPEDFEVEGFPTIYFLAKGESKPVKYDGGRELEDFSKYLQENAASLKKTPKEEL